MRVLLLTQVFEPEPMLKGMVFARELARRGHQVEVLTGFPNYPEGRLYPGYRIKLLQIDEVDGIRIFRVPSYLSHDASAFRRMASYLSFAISAALIGPWVVRRPDVIHANYGNATIGLPACVIGAVCRAPFVLDIQDLWPDTITSSGMLPRWLGFLVPVISAWCGFLHRQAARITVLSKGLKETLIARSVDGAKIEVIPNWCDEAQTRPGELPQEEARALEGRFNVVMAGNMGKVQGLEVVLDAAARLRRVEPRIQFVLVGGGVERPALEARATELGLSNVLFLPRRPMSEIGALLQKAEALFVHLKDEPLFAITIPSRIQAYLAVGRPVLCGVRGDGADLVREAEAGLCFPPEDAGALAAAVMDLARMDPGARKAMGDRGSHFYTERLSVRVGVSAFLDAFEACL